MATALDRDIRRLLDRAVRKARIVAEDGARKALTELGVEDGKRPEGLSSAQADLRNRLRAHARSLGDVMQSGGAIRANRLVREIAYEHWHRALFARFLAENNLLIDPDHKVAVSLSDLEEIAKEDGRDPVELAADWAEPMLPQIFRKDDPVLALALPPETRAGITEIVKDLPRAVFAADDSLGWVYQFWQADQKDRVNASEVKIGADELPAVTQLFTEDYMVLFLLENTLGAWWAGKVLAADPALGAGAASEEELRLKTSPPGYRWTYLRFVEAPSGRFDMRPEAASTEAASTWFNPFADIENLSGNLPHWRQDGTTYFVTFRTADSLPQEKLAVWQAERDAWLVEAASGRLNMRPEAASAEYAQRFSARIEEWLDAGYGECLLAQRQYRDIVESALRHFDGQRYRLGEHVVAANHVHAVVTPLEGHALSDILHTWKSYTAHEINRLAGRSGPFWQKESYDHIVRGPESLERIREYIRQHVDAASGRLNEEDKRRDAASTAWRPAAGAFEGWPQAAKEITVLDPCMGSGHFLVFALPILVAFRRAEEGLDERAAVKAVLADNLFGLEIDPRCTQIAAFALALASWKRLGGPEPLPRLNLACSGLAIGLGKAEFLKLAERITDASGWTGETNLLGTERTPLGERAAARLRGGLERLYSVFEKAPYLGSLVDPRRAISGDFGNLFEEGFEVLEGLLAKVLERTDGSHEEHEAAVTAQGIAKAAELLARRVTLVATNVPFLGNRRQSGRLLEFSEQFFERSKVDLSVTMLDRLISGAQADTVAAISPQAWLQQTRYRKFLEEVVFPRPIHVVLRYGPGAFETISGEVVSVCAVIISTTHEAASSTQAIDLSGIAGVQEKAQATLKKCFTEIPMRLMREKRTFLFQEVGAADELGTIAFGTQGVKTGDDDRFVASFWEQALLGEPWRPYLGTTTSSAEFSGRNRVLRWEDDGANLIRSRRDNAAFGRLGVAVNQMGELQSFIYTGEAFDSNVAPIICHDERAAPALFTFFRSEEFAAELRKIEGGMKINNGTLLRVPFDLAHWQRVAAEKYPNGLPKPRSNDPTQWLFDGHPRGSADPNVVEAASGRLNEQDKRRDAASTRPGMAEHPLQVAVARLLGYRWPRQTGTSFMDCPAVNEPNEMDRSGLVDADGIVPLPALAGEADAATRLRELIRAVWGPDYGEGTIRELLAAEEAKAADLGAWLADEFFESHCRLFHQTPFIWHVCDGVRGGFSALVNYHRLCGSGVTPLEHAAGGRVHAGRRRLEKLRDSYLGEWIAAQRRAFAAGEAGAEDRLIAAEHLRGELTKIIEGEPPYDIFVRWKPLHRQPIGWEPDIDDGVRLNIRPFLTAKPKNSGRRDGCILRVTPRVKKHAGADRGAEPHREKEDFPWFWAGDDVVTVDFAGGPAFKGRRYNDFHYTRAFKERARDAKGAAVADAAPERTLKASGKAP